MSQEADPRCVDTALRRSWQNRLRTRSSAFCRQESNRGTKLIGPQFVIKISLLALHIARVFRFDSTNRLEINQKVAATAVYRRIRRAVLVEGRSQRSVAREFGLARVTVRKMLG